MILCVSVVSFRPHGVLPDNLRIIAREEREADPGKIYSINGRGLPQYFCRNSTQFNARPRADIKCLVNLHSQIAEVFYETITAGGMPINIVDCFVQEE